MDKTLPGHPDPGSVKGRIITLEFEDYYVVGTYVVNAGAGLKVFSFTNPLQTSAYWGFPTDPRCEEVMEPTLRSLHPRIG